MSILSDADQLDTDGQSLGYSGVVLTSPTNSSTKDSTKAPIPCAKCKQYEENELKNQNKENSKIKMVKRMLDKTMKQKNEYKQKYEQSQSEKQLLVLQIEALNKNLQNQTGKISYMESLNLTLRESINSKASRVSAAPSPNTRNRQKLAEQLHMKRRQTEQDDTSKPTPKSKNPLQVPRMSKHIKNKPSAAAFLPKPKLDMRLDMDKFTFSDPDMQSNFAQFKPKDNISDFIEFTENHQTTKNLQSTLNDSKLNGTFNYSLYSHTASKIGASFLGKNTRRESGIAPLTQINPAN